MKWLINLNYPQGQKGDYQRPSHTCNLERNTNFLMGNTPLLRLDESTYIKLWVIFGYVQLHFKKEVKLFKECNEKDVLGQPTKVVDDVAIREEEV